MSDKKIVHHIGKFHDGGIRVFGIEIPYTKVWTLQAFGDSNNLLCEVSQKESNNYIKYVKFIKKVSDSGYILTRDQINQIRADGFFDEIFISQISKEHIFEVAIIQGYSSQYVIELPIKSKDQIEKFGLDLGLYPDEIYKVIERLKTLI
jgi:hypothetical protein